MSDGLYTQIYESQGSKGLDPYGYGSDPKSINSPKSKHQNSHGYGFTIVKPYPYGYGSSTDADILGFILPRFKAIWQLHKNFAAVLEQHRLINTGLLPNP